MKLHRTVTPLARLSLLFLLVAPVFGAGSPDLRLVEAVKKQDKDAINLLLKQRVDVNAPEGDGATALHWAASHNDAGTVDELLRLGAHVNAANDLGVTPLSLACLNGNVTIVQKLLTAGANPNVVMAGESALMTAARVGSADAVKALLVHGANVNAKEPARGQTALMWAAAQRHPEVVRLLIEAGADVQSRTLSYAIRVNYGGQSNGGGAGNPVTPGDYERGGSTPLMFAARNGDVESAGLLLAAGANVSDTTPDGMSVLTLAARSGRTEVAKLLIEKGADTNAAKVGYTALHAAVLMGEVDVVKELLAHGANPNIPLTKPEPQRRGNQDVALPVSFLGSTPLLIAAKFADVEMVRALLSAKADTSIPMKDGTTPLMAAAGFGAGGNRRGVQVLADAGYASLIDPNEEKDTFDSVKLLLDAGADVNAADPAGNTALFGAVPKGFNSVVQLLVDKGANVNAVNKRGQTPLKLAGGGGGGRGGRNAAGGLASTAALLRKLGATDQAPTVKFTINSEADYSGAMKEVAAQTATLRSALVTSTDEVAAAEAAQRLEDIFKEVQAFWAARKVEDAVTDAGNALAAAQSIARAAAAHDMGTANQATQTALGTCATCHTAHRDRLPDGTFKLK